MRCKSHSHCKAPCGWRHTLLGAPPNTPNFLPHRSERPDMAAAAQQFCCKPAAALQQSRPRVAARPQPAGRSLKLSLRAVAAPERPPASQVRRRHCNCGGLLARVVPIRAFCHLHA